MYRANAYFESISVTILQQKASLYVCPEYKGFSAPNIRGQTFDINIGQVPEKPTNLT
jgi:hypothetical protein